MTTIEQAHYAQLVGKTISGLVIAEAEGDIDEGIGLKFTDGTIVWILSDPEGNGTGFLEIVNQKFP
jgi:hypothetical protein